MIFPIDLDCRGMLGLLKQCSSLSQHLLRSPPTFLAPLSATQTRGFWRLVDNRYTDPDNKVGKYPQPSIEQDDIFDSRQEMYKVSSHWSIYQHWPPIGQ